MKKIVATSILAASILFGYSAEEAAQDLACKTITADAYYAKYAEIDGNNWWTYVSNDGSLVIAHEQGTTVKDMGTSFFVITDYFSSKPSFNYDGSNMEIVFPSLTNTSLSYVLGLSNKTLTADAYYAKYTEIDGNNWWTYVSNDGSLVIAHEQGTTVKDLGTSFFVITDYFDSAPTFTYSDGKINITFPALKGESCSSESDITPPAPSGDSELPTPPATPSLD